MPRKFKLTLAHKRVLSTVADSGRPPPENALINQLIDAGLLAYERKEKSTEYSLTEAGKAAIKNRPGGDA